MSEKVVVQPMDQSRKNSPIAGPIADESTVIMNKTSDTCYWNDRPYPDGAVVEADGVAYEVQPRAMGETVIAHHRVQPRPLTAR